MYAIWPAPEDEVSCFTEVSPVVSCHPGGEDATLLLPLNASCVLLPALEFVCAYGEPIQDAHSSEIPGYPTAHCLPCYPNQLSVGWGKWLQRTGSRSSPSGTWNHSQDSGKPFLISNHLPTCFQLWQHWRMQAKEKKVTSQTDIDENSFSRDHQRASRALKELQGEERRMSKPPYAKERHPAWLQPPGWSPPPVPAKRGDHPRRCI